MCSIELKVNGLQYLVKYHTHIHNYYITAKGYRYRTDGRCGLLQKAVTER